MNLANLDVSRSLFELDKADCAESLAEFVKQAWHVIEPGQPYVHGWHIDFLAAHLEAITDGVEFDDGTVYNRLLANVPPGTMKSLLVSVFWPAWWWGPRGEPHKRFLCASHSQSLAIRDSTKMRRLILSDWYQERWGDLVQLTGDQNAKTKFETTATGFREAVAAGSITGSRGDVVICFPAGQLVQAESGIKAIETVKDGERVWSVNVETGAKSLKPARLNRNPGSTIVEVGLSDGTVFRSTPDHRIWTRRGWVEAGLLQASDAIPCAARSDGADNGLCDPEAGRKFPLTDRGMQNFQNVSFLEFCHRMVCAARIIVPFEMRAGYTSPSLSTPDLLNCPAFDAVSLSEDVGAFCARGNRGGVISGKDRPRSAFKHRESSVVLGILDVLRPRSVFKVLKSGVSAVAVSVANFLTFRAWANKNIHHKLMDKSLFLSSVLAQVKSWVALGRRGFEYPFRNGQRPPSCSGDNTCFASNATHIADAVKPFVSGDRFPVFIRNAGHVDETFCLTVDDNHTFIVGDGEGVIVSNCDDPHSVEGASSDAMRQATIEWFLEAVPTRVNNPRESAIVVIMQRLHEEDVSGVILDKKLGYDHIMLPMRFEPGRAKPTLLGFEDPRSEEGELLFPARFPLDVVERDEGVMGPYACNTAEAPVLMADLSLKRIDQVRAGDEVLGWVRDEGGRSRMVRTRVKQAFEYTGQVVKMTLDSGEVIRCTPDHKWWRARWEKGRNEYGPAKVGTSLARVCPSSLPHLSADDQRLAGWLSGFFDGEGTVSVCKKNGAGDYRPSQQIHFYQGSGRNLPLCEKLERALTHFGFKFRYQEDERKPNKDAPCYGYRSYNLISGQQSLALAQRFMHIVQPTKWRNRIEDMALGAKFVQGWEKVVSIEPDGEEPVYALETETGNYVVWGLASSNSAGQFQQSPEPRGGGIIKRDWWVKWERPQYPQFEYVVASLDTAYTTKAENDPSAMTVWGVWSGSDGTAQITRRPRSDGELQEVVERQYREGHPKVMLMYAWAERLELHDLVERVRETMVRYGADNLLIENKAAGHSVAQELRRVYGRDDFGVQMYDPKTVDKMARLYSVQHLFADGLVHYPPKQWAEAVINQCAQFPRAKHDDLVDTVSMSLKHLRDTGIMLRHTEYTSDLDAGRMHHGAPPPPLYPV